MERLGDNPYWSKYLHDSFAANKPWDRMAREVLGGAPDEATRGAAFFYSKRLENYGQNPVDYAGLTRDVGRLFLGQDLRCAECHDHRFIKDYKQRDYQGLFAFFQNAYPMDPKYPSIAERPLTHKVVRRHGAPLGRGRRAARRAAAPDRPRRLGAGAGLPPRRPTALHRRLVGAAPLLALRGPGTPAHVGGQPGP
jgi:hypothetical protein